MKNFIDTWAKISSAVRAAIMAGKYKWTKGFDSAYYSATGRNLTTLEFREEGPFAVEPIPPTEDVEGRIHMLLFFPNGHCYEARLVDASGKVMFLWLHTRDWRERPLVTLAGRVHLEDDGARHPTHKE